MYEWRACAQHPWLGKSVLVGRGFSALCMREDGSAHPVDAADLKVAA